MKYEFIKSDVDSLLLNNEIKTNAVINKTCTNIHSFKKITDSEVHVTFDEVLTTQENNELNNIIGDHTNLATLKQERIIFIDHRTRELISEGFEFDNERFSLSAPAQSNWLGLKTLESLLTFPVEVTTIDDKSYSITSANLNSFVGVAAGVKQSHLDSGRVLKVSINNALNKTSLDAITDNR